MSVNYPKLRSTSPINVGSASPENTAATSPIEDITEDLKDAWKLTSRSEKKRKKKRPEANSKSATPNTNKKAEELNVVSKPQATTVIDEAEELSQTIETPSYSSKDREAVERILQLRSNPHKILQIPDPTTESEVKKGYKTLCLSIHPDKNKHPGANEAMQRVGWAHETLQKMFLHKEEMCGASYETDEFGSDSDDDEEQRPMEEQNSISANAPKYHKAIYKKAAPYIHQLYEEPNPKDSFAKKQLDYLNERIISQNIKDGLSKTDSVSCYVIPHKVLIDQVSEIKRIAERISTSGKNNPKNVEAARMQIEKANKIIELSFQPCTPSAWVKRYIPNSGKFESITATDTTNLDIDMPTNLNTDMLDSGAERPDRREIYNKATPYIERLFECPDDPETRKALDDLNTKLHKQNMKAYNHTQNYNHIPYQAMAANIAEARSIASKLGSHTPDQLHTLQLQLDRCNNFIETLIRQQKLPLSWVKKLVYDGEFDEVNILSITDDTDMESISTESEELPVEFLTLQPGYTHEGRKIVGYRAKKNRAGYITNEEFVVQIGGKNGRVCELRSRANIGNSAADAYLSLPDTSIVGKQSQFDPDRVNSIRRYLFVAWTHGAGRDGLPPLVAYVEYDHRLEKGATQLRKAWLWRTTLRTIKGRKDADLDIDKVLHEEGHRPSWKMRTQQRTLEYSRQNQYHSHPRAQKRTLDRRNTVAMIDDNSTSEYESSDEENSFIQAPRHSRHHESGRLTLENTPQSDDDIIQISNLINKLAIAKWERAQRANQLTRSYK